MARTKVTPKRRPQTSTVPPWLINKAKDNPSRTKNNQHNKKMATSWKPSEDVGVQNTLLIDGQDNFTR